MRLSKLKLLPAKILGRVLAWNDYRIYACSLSSMRRIVNWLPAIGNGTLLIVSGRGMNVLWAQIWSVLSLSVRINGVRGLVLTTRGQSTINRYFRLLGLELIYLDDLEWPESPPPDFASAVDHATTFKDVRDLGYKGAPVGQIALSTYSRHVGTGVVDMTDTKVAAYVKRWIMDIWRAMEIADALYREYNVKILFFTEVFMEEYGAFYYAAINRDLNVIRFAGTVRDDAFIIQHLSRANDRMHHSSLAPSSWERVRKLPYTNAWDHALMQNFADRYGAKWRRSMRNHPDTKIIDVGIAREQLGIRPGRKVAVIYSHILYDTLFFFGTDLFTDYAEWLIETTRAAIANPNLDWLIKVHPSNLWRGELDTLLKGSYEEERLLWGKFGDLPPHVRIVPADTSINPFTWFQLADYGITVRGTSGLEMAAFGKTVVTAGTGRYEGNGFTLDPPDKKAYLNLLARLHNMPSASAEQVELAKRYACAIFLMKPFTLSSMEPRLKTGKNKMVASDDIIYCVRPLTETGLPSDLARFAEWIPRRNDSDLLTDPFSSDYGVESVAAWMTRR
jgi:hypothetical protein